MRISSFVIGILLIGSMIGGLYAFAEGMGDSNSGYGVDIEDEYSTEFDYSKNLSNQIVGDYSKLQNISSNKGAAYLTMIPDAIILVKNIITYPFTLVDGIISSMVKFLHLPSWVTTLSIGILTIMLIFGVLALILRYRYT